MNAAQILKDAEGRMEKALDVLRNGLKGLRTGRASPAMLDGIRVDYYGSPTPVGEFSLWMKWTSTTGAFATATAPQGTGANVTVAAAMPSQRARPAGGLRRDVDLGTAIQQQTDLSHVTDGHVKRRHPGVAGGVDSGTGIHAAFARATAPKEQPHRLDTAKGGGDD